MRRIHLSELLSQPVRMNPAFRVGLAVLVIFGGLAFSVLGLVLSIATPSQSIPHPIGARLLALAMLFMGLGFMFVGARFVRPRASSSNIFGPVALKVCSVVVGALALSMAVGWWEFRNVAFLASAVFAAVLAYWLARFGSPREGAA